MYANNRQGQVMCYVMVTYCKTYNGVINLSISYSSEKLMWRLGVRLYFSQLNKLNVNKESSNAIVDAEAGCVSTFLPVERSSILINNHLL